MLGAMGRLTVHEILAADLTDWRKLARALHARYLTGDFATGAAFVAAVGELAEAAGHHPDLTLTYPWVDVRLSSHDVGAVTERDLALARQVSDLAGRRGLVADPAALREVHLALDTADIAARGPFWAALLTGDPANADADGDVVDPAGRVPLLWFQRTEPHQEPRQRFHLDVWIPHDLLQQRIDVAVAAGGTVVDDSASPSFVVLADGDGNRACLCTCLGR